MENLQVNKRFFFFVVFVFFFTFFNKCSINVVISVNNVQCEKIKTTCFREWNYFYEWNSIVWSPLCLQIHYFTGESLDDWKTFRLRKGYIFLCQQMFRKMWMHNVKNKVKITTCLFLWMKVFLWIATQLFYRSFTHKSPI